MYGEQTQAINPYYGGECAADRPYLARLTDIEIQLSQSADLMDEFVARCRGGGTNLSAKVSDAPVASGHFNTLERIVEQMTRIDKLARELGTIG